MRWTSNSKITLVQFAMNKHLQFFSRLQSQLDLGPDYMRRVGVSLPGSQHVCQTQQKSTSRLHEERARGPFLERPGKLLGPVSHPVSPRKLFGCFSKVPLFSIPLIFPVTCPVIYGRSWLPVKLPGSRKSCKIKQNGGRGADFFV